MVREWNSDLSAEIDIDVHALCDSIDRLGVRVYFVYDREVVAIVNGETYGSWHELAASFGLDASMFRE